MKKRFLTILIGAAAVLLIICAPLMAKPYVFIMPTPKGLSMGSLASMLDGVGNAIEKKTGIKVDVTNPEYTYLDDPYGDVLADMNKGKGDLAMLGSLDYISFASSHKTNAVPLFTVSMFGKTSYTLCMYTRKSDNFKSPADLKGKVWGGVKTKNARYILHENGIDKPMSVFFSKLKFIREENITVLVDSLLKKEIDVFTVPNYQVDMAKSSNAKFKEVVSINCSEYEHNWIIVYNKDTMKKSDAEKIKSAFLVAHKDKDFAQFKFILTAVKGRFVDIDVQNLKTTIKIAKLMKKYDWAAEEKAYIKKNFKE